jgi:hypothetical protein
MLPRRLIYKARNDQKRRIMGMVFGKVGVEEPVRLESTESFDTVKICD